MYALVQTREVTIRASNHKMRTPYRELARGKSFPIVADLGLAAMRPGFHTGEVALYRVDADDEYGRLSPTEVRELQYRMRTGEWPV